MQTISKSFINKHYKVWKRKKMQNNLMADSCLNTIYIVKQRASYGKIVSMWGMKLHYAVSKSCIVHS